MSYLLGMVFFRFSSWVGGKNVKKSEIDIIKKIKKHLWDELREDSK